MYDRQTLSKIIGSESVKLIDELLEMDNIIETGVKDGEKVIVNIGLMRSICDDKSSEIGYAIINHIISKK